jgi:hypothetical protein
MLHAPVVPGAFPPSERLQVITLASSSTTEHHPDSSWTLDNLAATILQETKAREISRSTIQRILQNVDLKPHLSQYWLNSHDPDFDRKAQQINQLYQAAPGFFEQGRVVFSSDEKTGMQILQRRYPTRLACPGYREKREFEYIRHGTRALLTTFCVPTGQVVWNVGPTRTSVDWVRHLEHVTQQFRQGKRFDWVVDNLNTHWSLDVCRWVAEQEGLPWQPKQLATGFQRRAFLCDPEHKHVFHFTPKHGSWLNQIELFFSVLSRRFLRRGDFADATDFETRLDHWLTVYNEQHARPYRWTYTGEPLVRATPFSQTRAQQQHGRAGFGKRPLWERLLYPPRPYQRHQPQSLAANL